MSKTYKISEPGEKRNLANKLKDINELYSYFKSWIKKSPHAFRLDGHDSIGPANPAQMIYFEIQEFKPESFAGLELTKKVNGNQWNGIYFLTASTRTESILKFIELYDKNKGDPNKIFKLGYTAGKEGQPKKRKAYLQADDQYNAGWFCKHYNH